LFPTNITVELQGTTITYYAGDTWQTFAGSYVTVVQGKVYFNHDDIICDNDYNPVNPNDQIDSDIEYRLQQAD